FLEESWPFVVKAVACIEGLLEENGLLPVSVSHEGYLAQPVHSYWDDFWALRGLRDAVDLAHMIEDRDAAARWGGVAEHFASALFGSIERTRALHKLDFIPGSVEWADFDPTATANAIAFLDVAEGLDPEAVRHTFDRYLSDWRSKRSGALKWANYTPYEIRIMAFSSGSGGAMWRSSCCASFCRIDDRRRGISGRKLRGTIDAHPRMSATCRTPGWRRNTSSLCAVCSPTNARQIGRSYWRLDSLPSGLP